jgi:hypothetical protein
MPVRTGFSRHSRAFPVAPLGRFAYRQARLARACLEHFRNYVKARNKPPRRARGGWSGDGRWRMKKWPC